MPIGINKTNTRYQKIHITGNAGAGKSTLAYELGGLLGIPCHSLDTIVWQPGWKETDAQTRQDAIKSLASGETWIIDGVSKTIRDAADLVIFLDVPRHSCLYRCAKRNWHYLFQSRPGLPKNCPEILIIPQLIKIIMDFPASVGITILSELHGSEKFRHITTSNQLKSIQTELKTDND